MSHSAIYLSLFIFFLWYLSFSATRLDRLHQRVETSWAALDGLLQRRAAIRVAVKLHVEAVNRTQLVRRKLIVRLFRLAGNAPLPSIHKFEADAI